MLAQLAELDGETEVAGFPDEDEGLAVFAAPVPLPLPPGCVLEDTEPVLVLVGEIDNEADSPT